jgi:hypothetical protein
VTNLRKTSTRLSASLGDNETLVGDNEREIRCQPRTNELDHHPVRPASIMSVGGAVSMVAWTVLEKT